MTTVLYPAPFGPETTIRGHLAILLATTLGRQLDIQRVMPGEGQPGRAGGAVAGQRMMMYAPEARNYLTAHHKTLGDAVFERASLTLYAAEVWHHIVESQITEDATQDDLHGAGTTGVIHPGDWPAGDEVRIAYVRLDNGPANHPGDDESHEDAMVRGSTYAVRFLHFPGTDRETAGPWLVGMGFTGVAEALAGYWHGWSLSNRRKEAAVGTP